MDIKNILTSAVVAAVVALAVMLVGGNHQPATLGGTTNYDSLGLSGSLSVGTSATVGTAQTIGTTLGIASTSPATAEAEEVIDGTGTTTLALFTTGTSSCIQMINSNKAPVRATINGTTWVIATGKCK